MTTQFEPDLAGLTGALTSALRSEDHDELRDALEWWVSTAHSPWTFAIAYLTARMRDDLIDQSEVGLILHESGWVN